VWAPQSPGLKSLKAHDSGGPPKNPVPKLGRHRALVERRLARAYSRFEHEGPQKRTFYRERGGWISTPADRFVLLFLGRLSFRRSAEVEWCIGNLRGVLKQIPPTRRPLLNIEATAPSRTPASNPDAGIIRWLSTTQRACSSSTRDSSQRSCDSTLTTMQCAASTVDHPLALLNGARTSSPPGRQDRTPNPPVFGAAFVSIGVPLYLHAYPSGKCRRTDRSCW